MPGLRQEFRVQRFAQEASQSARENRATEDTMKRIRPTILIRSDLYLILDRFIDCDCNPL